MTGDQQPLDPIQKLAYRLDINFALQAAGLGIWELDPVTNQVLWDDRCRELFGLAKDNYLPYHQALQFIHPDDVDRVNQAVQRAINPASNGQYDQTYRTIGANDGQLRWVRFYGQGYFSPSGELYRFAGVAQEVTEQVIAYKKMEDSESKLRAIIATAPAGIGLFVGRDLVIENPNQTFIDIVGKGPAIEGLPLREAMPELVSEGQPFLQILDDIFTTGEPFVSPGSLVKIVQNGVLQDNYYNITYNPVFDEAGQVYAILDIAIDVTQQIQAQQRAEVSEARYRDLSALLEIQIEQRTQELANSNEELASTNVELAASNEELTASSEDIVASNQQLEESNQNLVRSNQNLEQFAYIASHDLQEPLRKIQQFGDLLKSRFSASSVEELAYLDRIQVAASRMSQLIKDLLAFSRISTSQASITPVDLSWVNQQAVETLSMVVEETGAQLSIEKLPVVPGDRLQLEQLFFNLLANALKFSRQDSAGQPTTPHITIRSQRLAAADLPPSVIPPRQAQFYERVDIGDNGVGFDEKYLNRIFQVFQRLYGKSEFAGTGIGLAICQKVVDNHGGVITASSKPRHGATFSVYLPA